MNTMPMSAGVSLSHSLGAETVRQTLDGETGRETSCETPSLKVLANKVLARQRVRRPVRQSVRQEEKKCLTPEMPVRQNFVVVSPDFSTGLEWIVWPADDTDPDFEAKWAAVDLRDLGKLYGVRVVHAGERFIAVFDPTMEPELVAYASELLAEARPYLAANMDRLPILTQAEAVKILLDIMRQHKGLRFCRGAGGSRWPLFPKGWTAGQKATVQSLWFAAGDALDEDSFMGVDA